MKARHNTTLGPDHNFTKGYDMKMCSHCESEGRTIYTTLHLECGAQITGYLCRSCYTLPVIDDKRTHVHVGKECKVFRHAIDWSDQWFRQSLQRMALDQIQPAFDDARTALTVPAMTFDVRVCGGAR